MCGRSLGLLWDDDLSCSMADQHKKHEPVGLAEIGERLRFKRDTVEDWWRRGLLLEPRWTVGGDPAWCWRCDIEPWARRWGRL
jgi:hypothetical protein